MTEERVVKVDKKGLAKILADVSEFKNAFYFHLDYCVDDNGEVLFERNWGVEAVNSFGGDYLLVTCFGGHADCKIFNVNIENFTVDSSELFLLISEEILDFLDRADVVYVDPGSYGWDNLQEKTREELETKDEECGKGTMKFKVGDRVRVKKRLIANKYYKGIFVSEEMAEKRGTVSTVEEVRNFPEAYILSDRYFLWDESMLEPEIKKTPDKKYFVEMYGCVDKSQLEADVKRYGHFEHVTVDGNFEIIDLNTMEDDIDLAGEARLLFIIDEEGYLEELPLNEDDFIAVTEIGENDTLEDARTGKLTKNYLVWHYACEIKDGRYVD